jgi:hypothetical protein
MELRSLLSGILSKMRPLVWQKMQLDVERAVGKM